MLYSNAFNKIYNFHKSIVSEETSLDIIKNEKSKTIFSPNDYNLQIYSKNIYEHIFYGIVNIIYFVSIGLNRNKYFQYINDTKYIENIMSKQDLDMIELRIKSDIALNNQIYSGILNWIAGNCWSNALITNGYTDQLDSHDKYIIDSINKGIELVEPIDKALVLFHGFEKFSNYKEKNFYEGQTFTFPGILSKTAKFSVAEGFALSQNYLQPKYFVMFYKPGSKHLGLDTKPKQYDEYEYIGKSGETFRIIKICRLFKGFHLQTFYVCENLDY